MDLTPEKIYQLGCDGLRAHREMVCFVEKNIKDKAKGRYLISLIYEYARIEALQKLYLYKKGKEVLKQAPQDEY